MKIKLKRTSPNYRRKLSTPIIMRDLTIGLLVIVAYSLYWQFSNADMNAVTKAGLIYLVSVGVALVTEVLWALAHKSNILEHLKNSYPLVTSIIFALTLPIGTPLYVVAIGSFIAIFFGKLVYGGFGSNIFNPALVGRVIVHLSYGATLKTSLPFNGIDLATKATPATMLAGTSWLGGEGFTYTLSDLFLGNHAGTLGETCIWLILVVGVLLAMRKVFDARIPVAYLGTVLVLSEVFAIVNGLDPVSYPIIQLCLGGVVFGAVFMATDPVTSPTSPLGKILFGIGLGFLTMIIRFKANYPEGVLFSILLMNMLTPWIDSLIVGRTNQQVPKQILTIVLTVVVAMGCTFGIANGIKNDVIAAKEAEIEAAKKKAEAEQKAAEEAAKAIQHTEKDGTDVYTLTSKGFGAASPMKIEVTIKGDKISVKVVEYAGETEGYGLDLIEGQSASDAGKAFYSKILNSSFTENDLSGIDTSTGATMTTKGIVSGIENAINAHNK